MSIILYSTGCPRCNVLKKKMAEKNIEYTECTDENKMIELGIQAVPVLSIDGELLDFATANAWINKYMGE